jgi:hypothetical protein
MPLKVTFDLADADLKHFRTIMAEARKAASDKSADEILDAAAGLMANVGDVELPDFVSDRLEKVETMVEMVRDAEWQLPKEETDRVINALSYFAEPEDLIPDHIPGLGFLDDAIMVELVVRELRHEIQAYNDFCIFRRDEEKRRARAGGPEDDVSREEWLSARRQQLHKRMRNRRRKQRSTSRAARGGRSPFSLF